MDSRKSASTHREKYSPKLKNWSGTVLHVPSNPISLTSDPIFQLHLRKNNSNSIILGYNGFQIIRKSSSWQHFTQFRCSARDLRLQLPPRSKHCGFASVNEISDAEWSDLVVGSNISLRLLSEVWAIFLYSVLNVKYYTDNLV